MDKQYLPLDRGEYRQMKDGDEVSTGEVRFKCDGPDTVEAEIYDMGVGHVVVLSDGESLTVIKDARPGQFAQR